MNESSILRRELAAMKEISPLMASASGETKNRALTLIAEGLKARWGEIAEANAEDLSRAEKEQIPSSVKKRLNFTEEKREACIRGIQDLIAMEDPVGRALLHRSLDEGLILKKISCPIGVIGVIFEARPDAMVQIASLCIKSGNCAVLKGGKETAQTNRVLFGVIHEAAVKAGLPEKSLLLAQSHAEIDTLLTMDKEVDLLIPRGSNAFVRYIIEHTKIPVMGHADGICHIYVDKEADLTKAVPLIQDAKLQYSAACNAVETVLLHESLMDGFYPVLKRALEEKGVKLHGPWPSDVRSPGADPLASDDSGAPVDAACFEREYLGPELTLGVVPDVRAAIAHINRHGSHHTDAILTENEETADLFAALVDSAGVYVNCSTRFADGYRYGFGAEVGISTGKLHARGPVGVEGLLTYKYVLRGSGTPVADYAEGRKSFHFRELSPG